MTRRLADRGLLLAGAREPSTRAQADGKGWPYHAHTMVGTKRLDNIEACVSQALADGVPGDLIETGVWRGGASIFMRAILEAYEVEDSGRSGSLTRFKVSCSPTRSVSSRRGREPALFTSSLAVSLATVRTNFDRYGLLDEQVQFLAGWFGARCRMHRSNDSRSCGSTVTSTSPPWTR